MEAECEHFCQNLEFCPNSKILNFDMILTDFKTLKVLKFHTIFDAIHKIEDVFLFLKKGRHNNEYQIIFFLVSAFLQ